MNNHDDCFYHPNNKAIGECVNCGRNFCKKLKIRGINTQIEVNETIEDESGQEKEITTLKTVYCPVCVFEAINAQTENMRSYYLKNIGSIIIFALGIFIGFSALSYDPLFASLILIISIFMVVNILYHLVYHHPKLIREIRAKKEEFYQDLDPAVKQQLSAVKS